MSGELISGLHHVTAIASNAQKNYDFYHAILGLRLVKQTVNFDDPTSYHLYYGDDNATPGTLITFFTWPLLPTQTHGAAEIASVGFAVSQDSLAFWKHRLTNKKIAYTESTRGIFPTLCLTDFDGMQIELVGIKNPRDLKATHRDIPPEHAICGIEYVVQNVANIALLAEVLQTLGYAHTKQFSDIHQFTHLHDHFFVKEMMTSHDAIQGIGSIHHVAFAVANSTDQDIMREKIHDLGHHVTAQIDRSYFHAAYFREHNGILFEISTNGPGFAIDEKLEDLGKKLCLPPQYAKHRAEIEKLLPAFKL